MSRIQPLLAVTGLLVAASVASAQHAIIKPGDVIAGKTLTAASDIAVSDNGRLVFRGAFEEGGKQQAALFDYDLSTKAAKLIASTETPFDGFSLTDVGQPSLSSAGKLVWRGTTDQGAVIFGDDGPFVKTGDSTAPGKTAVAPYEPLINDKGTMVYFDPPGAYKYPSTEFAEFPWLISNSVIGAPLANSGSFVDFGVGVFVDSNLGDIVAFVPTSNSPSILFRVGQHINSVDEFTRGFAVSRNDDLTLAFIADLGSVRSAVFHNVPVANENDLVDGQKLGKMTEIELTNSSLIYVASEGRVVLLPEPRSFVLAGMAAAGIALTLIRRRPPSSDFARPCCTSKSLVARPRWSTKT